MSKLEKAAQDAKEALEKAQIAYDEAVAAVEADEAANPPSPSTARRLVTGEVVADEKAFKKARK